MRITGITGTNGKTTCAYLITQCLEGLGHSAAYMGTIGWGRIGRLETPTHTTPDAVSVHRLLARLKSQGVREVAMEVSSHALDQGRVDAVRFHSAAFTNLSRDHLDYHPSMQAYAEAKARLFAAQDLEQVIINVGDPFGRELAHRLAGGAPLTAVWIGPGADAWLAERYLEARDVRLDWHGISLDIVGSSGEITVSTHLLGRFNAENVLVVLGCLLSLGVPLRDAAAALAACDAPPGRMEVIEAPAPGKPLAVIDYAHTPDALAKALHCLREHCRGELWCVFGCGGDRDPGKRPIMGAIADELADQIIVTDDNPRSEEPQEIIRAITRGIKAHAARVSGSRRGDSGGAQSCRRRRRRAHRGQGTRGLPDLRRHAPQLQRSGRGAQDSAGCGMKRTLQEAARVLGAPLVGDDRPFETVSTDSRTLTPGALFVALRGPNFDGADFAAAALARGAAGAIVERPLAGLPLSYVRVPDTLAALQELARGWRDVVLDPRRGSRRQQRQDHDQGDDGGDPVAPRTLPRDAGQPQQPHRRALDAPAPRAIAQRRRDRDGGQPLRATSPRWLSSRGRPSG